jgi:hypothetical protein
VDDTASIHENKVIEDQVYYKTSTALTEADQLLMLQPRHWADPPMAPFMTATALQPPTANNAIRKWEVNADAVSLASRTATWGTRRNSGEHSLSESDDILDGTFLQKLSISRPKEPESHRSNSVFHQGLVRLASLVGHGRRDSTRKRSRSPENAELPRDRIFLEI